MMSIGGYFKPSPSSVVSYYIAPADLAQTVCIRNPHFDITTLELVAGVVTERGIMTPEVIIAFLNNQSIS
jgi:methylthioribose-1-phosphate isomerase